MVNRKWFVHSRLVSSDLQFIGIESMWVDSELETSSYIVLKMGDRYLQHVLETGIILLMLNKVWYLELSDFGNALKTFQTRIKIMAGNVFPRAAFNNIRKCQFEEIICFASLSPAPQESNDQ